VQVKVNVTLFLGNNFCSGKKLLQAILKWRDLLQINPKVRNVKIVVTENSVTSLLLCVISGFLRI